MKSSAKLPLGFENFREIRTKGFYYVDKTGMIRSLLKSPAKVTLFTRPRRFGKTLNMSMLRCFFETGSEPALFDGLEIAKERKLCEEYMGKFPVVSLTLKDVEGKDFEEAKGMLGRTVAREALRFQFLAESERLSETERLQYQKLIAIGEKGVFSMADELVKDSLLILSRLLQKHYGESTILLIDEYDVPLDKAYRSGYYDEMVNLIRGIFSQVLKTNDSLHFAVLTGCLRISRESIFTGMNNFKVYTINDESYNEFFGFTDEEVKKMLGYYGFAERYDAAKEWYDGYRFGNLGIYCPWDVVNYCYDLREGNAKEPQNYWVNTSSNDLIRKFVDRADAKTKMEIELLVDGGSIKKKIRQELTYRDLDSTIDNLWSILFTTGYLTQTGKQENGVAELLIPNKEIRWVFAEQIQNWFDEESAKDTNALRAIRSGAG